ncbi:MAG TPA: enoyl-CoA hydratase/isomerase family protein [Acetobacteraceae bacterium]|nr:enoyl-CoA hydratase/isomerase family protein [Acetobacteraceae bacterium]
MSVREAEASTGVAVLAAARLPEAEVSAWIGREPQVVGGFAEDCERYGHFWLLSEQLIARLPKKQARTEKEAQAAEMVRTRARGARARFLAAHSEAVYAALTEEFSRFVRLEALVLLAAERFPGLVPSRNQLAAEAGTFQRDKDGLEIDQGIFLSAMFAHERAGLHLCHAMLLPRAESLERLETFVARGVADFGAARLERRDRAVLLETANPRFLNAEDETTLHAMEIAVDLAILDPLSEIAVMRGGRVQHAKYRGRHLFGSGINLTHLYQGRIPFVWYLQRDLGFVHKLLRGVARPEALPDDVHGEGIEKPWIAVVDGFAIGGHCQILLAVDYVLAADNAYLSLPARKEGIIPGFANLRLPRFTGERLARQLIQYERRLDCAGPEGRLLCDEIVPAAEMDAAITRIVTGLTSSGAVSAVGNRRAFRVGAEPLDLFRRYCAAYAREQAECHFSPALIANLERYWGAQNRQG